ncbi:hypothetical protein M8845_19320, partial [Gelidibacter japonicus]|nr:hypothetical protein [Gelidibacter japonicus]
LVLAYLENPADFPMASTCLQLSVTNHATAHTRNVVAYVEGIPIKRIRQPKIDVLTNRIRNKSSGINCERIKEKNIRTIFIGTEIRSADLKK